MPSIPRVSAEGYARSTGKVGVLLVTSGPGATNTVTGLTDSVPASKDYGSNSVGTIRFERLSPFFSSSP